MSSPDPLPPRHGWTGAAPEQGPPQLPTPDLGRALHTARCGPRRDGGTLRPGRQDTEWGGARGPPPPPVSSCLSSSREPFRPAPSPRTEALRALSTSSPACGPGWAARAWEMKEGQTLKRDRPRPAPPSGETGSGASDPRAARGQTHTQDQTGPEASLSARGPEEEGRLIQEETGILRSGVRGDGGETEAGVTGRDRLCELRGQQAAQQPLPLCVPQTQKQMQSRPCCPSAFMPSFWGWTPSPKVPKQTEAWGQGVGGGDQKFKIQEPRASCTAYTPKPAQRTQTPGREGPRAARQATPGEPPTPQGKAPDPGFCRRTPPVTETSDFSTTV